MEEKKAKKKNFIDKKNESSVYEDSFQLSDEST